MDVEPKRLYVVSSAHYVSKPKENEKSGIVDVVEVRLSVIEAIAKALKKGGYFSDGLWPGMAIINRNILESDSLRTIRKMAQDAFEAGGEDLFAYELLKAVELLKKLRSQGVHFELKQTEDTRLEDGEPLRFYWKELREDPKIKSVPKEGPFKQDLFDYISDRITELRDRAIVKNIINSGESENILYVGYKHKLADLNSSPLESYRLEIAHEAQRVIVSGVIPEDLQKSVEKLRKKTRQGKKVEKEIEYIKRPS